MECRNLGSDSPKSLLRTVFYQNGENLCLRGRSEHRNLKLSQLQRRSDPNQYIYTENGLKNRSGRLNPNPNRFVSTHLFVVTNHTSVASCDD